MRTDVVLLVPFQPSTGTLLDGHVRRSGIARVNLPILEARLELERYLGRRLEPASERWRGSATRTGAARQAHRSASAVVLASALEAAGLLWEAHDPGAKDIDHWRRVLTEARARDPRAVAICTTFVVSAPWLRLLCEVARRALPNAKLLVGGYYYATSTRDFLSLDADVLAVGEGERRLPEIVRAIRDGAELERIPGLYLKRPDEGLVFTGRAEPLDLETLPQPDWRLAERIQPPARIDRDALVYVAETQRGCIFKCEYCTYRTLAELKLMSAARAADVIASSVPKTAAPGSQIDVIDATATYPRERWEELMRLLASRGGAPAPISAYARVSDISEHTAELMAKAGLRRVFIGQESGDQELLNRMKKGTKVSQVRPATHALWRHRIDPLLSFIHGFPGECQASLENTRRMIAELNDGFDGPACTLYRIEPFSVYDFATVSRSEQMADAPHYLGYRRSGELGVSEVMDEVLRTVVAISKRPEAPVCESLLDWMRFPTGWLKERLLGPDRARTFVWLKAMERGVAIFLERHLDGTRPDPAELARVRSAISAELPAPEPLSALATKSRVLFELAALRRLRAECALESERGPGPFTRVLLGAMLVRDTGDPRAALRDPSELARVPEPAREVENLAARLVDAALRPRKIDVSGLRAGRL